MELQERSYAGKTFRPKPLVVFSEADSTLIILSSWGHSDESQQVARIFQDQIQAGEAEDHTSPFEYIESLGALGNRLNVAAHLANDYLFRNTNQSEYVAGVEVLAIAYRDRVLSWVQVGGPHLLLVNQGSIQPLASQFDWSWQYNQEAPLPSQCLGLQRSLQVQSGSVILEPGANLFMICRGMIPSKVFQEPQGHLGDMAKLLAEQNVDTPFWLGHLKL